MIIPLSIILAIPAFADNPVPYYTRTTDKNQSMGAINKNLLDITGRNRDKLSPIVGDQTCLPGQALLGATEKKGYIFGGTCGGAQLLQIGPQTLFQILQSTPSALWQIVACSNCVPPKLLVSTGTSRGNYSDMVGGAFK